MQTKLTTDQRLTNLEEEMASVKEGQTAMHLEMSERFDQVKSDMEDGNENLGKKLDKILEVVGGKQARMNARLEHLEHHRTHPPVAQ